MKKLNTINLQLFAESGVNFEEIISKHAGEDGNIPADQIPKLASAISSAVGRAFVDKKRYGDKLDEIETLKTEKQTAEDALATAQKWEERYNNEHNAFEQYKTDTEARANLDAVKAAYKKLLTAANIDPKRHDAILRVTPFDGMKLTADGTLENADELAQGIESDYGEFKVTTFERGPEVATPPLAAPARRTKEEIMAIKDTGERQRAIAENHDLFGF